MINAALAPNFNLELLSQDARWNALSLEERATEIAQVLAQDCWHNSPFYQKFHDFFKGEKLFLEASLVLANDDKQRSLNHDYRGLDKTTNVLSFATLDQEDAQMSLPFELPQLYLGDIILSYDCLAREVEQQSISLLAHSEHLIMHGLLHLMGYLHDSIQEAEIMEMHESRIMLARGWHDPYTNS